MHERVAVLVEIHWHADRPVGFAALFDHDV
jgi:hypothetical protein